ncbi:MULTISPECIES: RNA polymerase sigma factor [Acinetobacter]|uniref:RNA polymerase sigma factor n=1 Tax=Acinetobacter TaxID=469 RepID=UPI000DD09CC2|nr:MULTISPECIES: RNA polymerase sigma factor [Acinetobacter]MCL6237320.1 RNA polymerase sigma factor [Acinetobacter amyesii]MCL6240524.1 RNA polymerase sigma factor [Acinetobacter amyesii]QOW49171.1 RNA polymerase sigma factor [Acinetobacter sp. YH12138]UUS59182.1 RNA polymerase sigma factor [Acinetobacter sp. YH16040_T]UUS62305.1 RNA polymerase sigma factor [Acinetobacter sp. YH16056_T]
MDLAPKKSETQDSSVLKSTAESRLKNFMNEVTGRALVMMESATHGQHGIAMDLVQEAFISLHKAYAEKSTEEWYPLFYTILNNKLQDWRRKEARRSQPFSLFRKVSLDDDDVEIQDVVDESTPNPFDFLDQAVTAEEIQDAIAELPVRQQQAFMLRAWEGFDTHTTAEIMNCSEGSVKTHYHRAIQGLRTALAHLNPHMGGSSE